MITYQQPISIVTANADPIKALVENSGMFTHAKLLALI
jgi:hypothetical protein